MNVFMHELLTLRRSLLAWVAGLCLLVSIYFSVYPSFAHDVQASMDIIMQYPPAVRDAFGLSVGAFLSFSGFYGFVMALLVVAAAVQAMNLGLSSLSKEASMKTADFLLSKPIARGSVFLGKLAASSVILLLTALAIVSFSLALAWFVAGDGLDVGRFLQMSSCLVFIQAWFLSVGMLVSAIAGKLRSVVSVSLSVVMGLYVLGSLGGVLGEDAVRFIVPFRYFDLASMASTGSFDGSSLGVWGCVCASALVISYLVYRGKDISAVA